MTFEEAHEAISNKAQVHWFDRSGSMGVGIIVAVDMELPGILAIPRENLSCVVQDESGEEFSVRVSQVEYVSQYAT